MKKPIIDLLVIIFLLFSVVSGYCKGNITDFDAYSTYFGKSKSQVKIISPNYLEIQDNMWRTDAYSFSDNDYAILLVNFDENKVNFVIAQFTSGCLDFLNMENNNTGTFELGSTILGFDLDTIVASLTTNDGDLLVLFPENTVCSASLENDYGTFVCGYNEDLATNIQDVVTKQNQKEVIGNVASKKEPIAIEVPGGRYVIGEDIPAGNYSITIKDGGTNITVWGSAYKDYKTNGGLLLNITLFADENPQLGKVVLEEGNVIDFSSALFFETYEGIDFSVAKPTVVPGGRYIIGEDIPANSYSITIKDGGTNITVWGSAYKDYKTNGGLLLNITLLADDNPQLGKVILNEGNVIDFSSPVIFGPPNNLSFK